MVRLAFTGLAALLGLAFGSFLNVCLTRWPAGESVVSPRSHCRTCGQPIAGWENIPVFSWIFLRGRCQTCRTWIGIRYPTVETAVGLIWAVIAWQTWNENFANLPEGTISFSLPSLFFLVITVLGKLVLAWALVGLAALDAEHLWLPDIITLSGILLGTAFTLVRGEFLPGNASGGTPLLLNLLNIAVAIVCAAGLILVIRWVYYLLRRREGIGLGDAKLMAMLGAWLGISGVVLAFAVGVLLGALAAVVLLLLPGGRRERESWAVSKLPLGTFLCMGGIASLLWGRVIVSSYLKWAGF